MIERKSDAATLRFRQTGPGLYSIDLMGNEGASGADLKRSINDAFVWMFVNTDAMVLRGRIAGGNKRCLAMVPHVPGYRLDRGGRNHEFSLTLAHWAKFYGIEKALAEMRAASQSAKADKLEAAAKAAGVL